MKPRNSFTAEEAKKVWNYDPESGILTWKNPCNRKSQFIGKRAGYTDPIGYTYVSFKNSRYLLHRIIWLIVTGKWPENEIDHINGIKNDNKLENLREATSVQNKMNCEKRKRNKSGYKGVSWDKQKQKWRAQISIRGKRLHLGYFDNKGLAAYEYNLAAKKYHGEFAHLNVMRA